AHTPPPQPPAYQTPPPAFQTPPPHFPQAHTPPPQPMPAPFQPAPASNSGGCSTALVIVGIIVGVIVLAVIIIAIVVNRAKNETAGGSTSRVSERTATVLHLDGPADRNGLL
ncbi:hypothetical protein ACWC5I_21370, partial [Kitasatospora sp. NPDC001574]